MKRIYLVTGGLGHLGSTIVKALLRRGEIVRALIVKDEKRMREEGVSYYTGDVRDRDSLIPFFQHERDEELYLIHTAGLISIQDKGMKDLYSVNVGGTENILAMAKEYNVSKMVYVSSVHTIPERKDRAVLRETDIYDPSEVRGEYAKSKAEASALVKKAADNELYTMIALPSGIIGPGDGGGNHLVQMCLMFLSGRLPMGVRGGYDMVDVRDVANGIIKMLEKGRKGESYILSGSSVSIKEIIRYMAEASGKKVKPCVPISIARIVAPFFEIDAKRRRKRPLFTKYSLSTLESNSRFSHDKATLELGYYPRDVSDSVRDMVAYLEERKEEKREPFAIAGKNA